MVAPRPFRLPGWCLVVILSWAGAGWAQTQATCETWLGTDPNPVGIPSVPAPGISQRNALLAAGGKLVAIGSRYYAVSIPDAFYSAALPVLVVDLHGTGGYPEAEWNDWHSALADRGYGFVGLAWGGGTASAASDTDVYADLKQILQDVGTVCPVAGARKWLLGFSVGSAMSFAVMIRDVADRHLFYGQVAVSGASAAPLDTGKEVMHATVEANRGNADAVLGIKSWMYCGEQDFDHGWSMCEEMPLGEAFVDEHGGDALLYRDPSGSHHSLPGNTAARDQMLDFLARIQPDDGLWVIDAENNGQSGRGFQLEVRGGVLVFTYYGYGGDGSGLWALSAGPMSGNGYSGSLDTYAGGTALGGDYQPAAKTGSLGVLSLAFTSASQGTITLPSEGTRAISRFPFAGSASPPITPRNGLWVVDAENNGQSGRGFQIEQHGGLLVFTYYGYGSGGEGLWALSAGDMSGAGYGGSLDRYSGGTALGGTYRPAKVSESAGSFSLSFSTPTSGLVTFPGEAPKAISKFNW
jgi:hypothetical protein